MADAFLAGVYPAVLRALLAAVVFLVVYSFPAIKEEFRGLAGSREAAGVALLFALALGIRLWAVPHTHQVYFDEFEHVDIAEHLARTGTFAESLVGGFPDYDVLSVPTWPGGFHTLLSLVFKATGPSERAAYNLNAWLGAASVVLLWLAALHAFRISRTAWLSAFLLAVLPVHLQFSGCADLTASSVFWVLATLLALSLYQRRRERPLYFLLLSVLLYAAHTRFENIILIPLCAAILRPRRFQAADGAFLAGLLPLAALILRNRAAGLPGFGESIPATLLHLARNVPLDLLYLLRQKAALIVLGPGLFLSLRKPEAGTKAALALSAAYLLVYASFFRGNFNIGSENRYSLLFELPLLAAAAHGLSRKPALAWAAAPLFLLLAGPGFEQLSSDVYEREYRFIQRSAPALPADAYVVSYSPSAVLVAARRPSISALLYDDDRKAWDAALSRHGDRLILFKDHWWFERDSKTLEAGLQKEYRWKLLAGEKIDGRDYGFYELARL